MEIDYYETNLQALAIGAKHLSFAAYCSEVDEKWKRDIFLNEFHELLYTASTTGGKCWEERSFVAKNCDFVGHDCVAYLYVCTFLKMFIVSVRGTRTMLQLVEEFVKHLFVQPEAYRYSTKVHGETARTHYAPSFQNLDDKAVLGYVNPYFHRAGDLLWAMIKPVLVELMSETETDGTGEGPGALKYPDYRILFTGHSMGGAISSLLNMYAFQEGLRPPDKLLLITMGQPRTVDQTLARFYDLHLPYSYLIVLANGKSTDVVRLLPPVMQLWLDSVGPDGVVRNSFTLPNGQSIENFQLPHLAHRVTYGGSHFPHHFGVQVLIESGGGSKARLLPSRFRHPDLVAHAESEHGCNGLWSAGELLNLLSLPRSYAESARRWGTIRDVFRMVHNHCQYMFAWGEMASLKSVRHWPNKLLDVVFHDDHIPRERWTPQQRRAFEARLKKAGEAEKAKEATAGDLVLLYMNKRAGDEEAFQSRMEQDGGPGEGGESGAAGTLYELAQEIKEKETKNSGHGCSRGAEP